MNKNTVIIINPRSLNLMKAIYNALAANLLEIIILGNRCVIYNLCNEINLNINLLQIVDCNEKKDVYYKLKSLKEIKNINGIIFDDYHDEELLNIFSYHSLCYLIDFGIFKKSVFLIRNTTKINLIKNINDTIELIKNMDIRYLNIGIVYSNREQAIYKRKQLKNELGLRNVDVIDEDKISKCKYNIIIFDDKYKEIEYLNKINTKFTRNIEIKKASNVFLFDAKEKDFKNIFLQFIFLSKVNCLDYKFNTQAI